MNLKDFKRLYFGVYLLTDGISYYHASVYSNDDLGISRNINIYVNNEIGNSLLSISDIDGLNPCIGCKLGSIFVYSKYSTSSPFQFIEFVGRCSYNLDEIKLKLKNHRMNMKISRKIRS